MTKLMAWFSLIICLTLISIFSITIAAYPETRDISGPFSIVIFAIMIVNQCAYIFFEKED